MLPFLLTSRPDWSQRYMPGVRCSAISTTFATRPVIGRKYNHFNTIILRPVELIVTWPEDFGASDAISGVTTRLWPPSQVRPISGVPDKIALSDVIKNVAVSVGCRFSFMGGFGRGQESRKPDDAMPAALC